MCKRRNVKNLSYGKNLTDRSYEGKINFEVSVVKFSFSSYCFESENLEQPWNACLPVSTTMKLCCEDFLWFRLCGVDVPSLGRWDNLTKIFLSTYHEKILVKKGRGVLVRIKCPFGFCKVYKSLNMFFMVENNRNKIVVDEVSDLCTASGDTRSAGPSSRRSWLTSLSGSLLLQLSSSARICPLTVGRQRWASTPHENLRMNYFCREYSDSLNENVSAL